jgi:pimeloyl-ACP methyl ester carboxylesterase
MAGCCTSRRAAITGESVIVRLLGEMSVHRVFIASACAFALIGCGHKPGVTPASHTAAPSAAVPGTGVPQLANSADGVHIEYHVYGKGEPAVVLVHGWSCDANYWSAQLDDLKANYTVVTIDLAGHGASGANRADWSMKNYGEDVAAVVRQLPNQQIVLVGHSMGGPVILETANILQSSAADARLHLIGLIGVDTFKQMAEPVMSRERLDALLKPFQDDFIGATRKFVGDFMFTKQADPKFVNKVAYDMSLEPSAIAIASIRGLFEVDYPSVLKGLSMPIVAINSDLGKPVDEARIRKVAPTFRMIVLPGTGHFFFLEAPKRFNPILEQQIQLLLKSGAA